jgi:ribonuclease P protein component
MLPRERRVNANYDFKKVRRRGKRVNTSFFTLYFLRKAPTLPSRFGFVVSTRIDKRAVKRNSIRRILGEEVRSLLPRIKDGFDLVFWVRKGALDADPRVLRGAVRKALGNAQVLGGGGA